MTAERKFEHKKTYYNDIFLRLLHRLFHVEHLHYGYFGSGIKPQLANMAQAQSAYVKHLLSFLPRQARKVFDVGCGTGGVASELVKKGLNVTCIAPDAYMVDMTEKRTQGRAKYFVDLYENVTDQVEAGTFDLILMSESCQYIKPDPGWANHVRLLRPGGWILVADFFKIKQPDERNPSKSGQPLDDFLRRASENGFKVVKKDDITDRVAPTMDIYQDIILNKAFPVVQAIFELVERRFPFVYRTLKRLFGAKIEKIKSKYEKQGSALFREYKRYMIFLLQKK